MVCTSVTVVQPKPVISALTAKDMGGGNVDISWNQDIAGNVKVSLDTFATIVNGGAGYNATRINGVTVGTHQICVDAV